MRIVSGKVSDLSAEERARCRSLSFRADGDLAGWITDFPSGDIVRVFIDDLLVGWGMKTPNGQTGYYVRSAYRRQGIGSKIYWTLNTSRSKAIVFPHDSRSASFFYSVGRITKTEAVCCAANPKDLRRKPRSKVMSN